MTANPTAIHVTADELAGIAINRLDRLALRVALSTDLGEVERHADMADLTAAYGALRTLLDRGLLSPATTTGGA